MSYILFIGRQQEGYIGNADRDVIKYRGRLDAIHDLDIPSVEIAHQIASLCNIKCYAIAKSGYNYNDNVVFETSDITEWDKAIDKAREEDKVNKTEFCAHINKLPTKYDYGKVAGYDIFFERSEAEYNPRYRNKVEWSLSIKMKRGKYTDDLQPDCYRSKGYGKGKKRLHARFERDFKHDIEDQAQRDKLWDELPKIEARFEELKRQIANA